jgi:CCR4-NOT transcription complex subunit 1
MDNNPPNPNIHTIVKAQIVFLLSTLTEDNFDFNQNQIHTVRTQILCGYPFDHPRAHH